MKSNERWMCRSIYEKIHVKFYNDHGKALLALPLAKSENQV